MAVVILWLGIMFLGIPLDDVPSIVGYVAGGSFGLEIVRTVVIIIKG